MGETRSGFFTVSDGQSEPQVVRLVLSEDTLTLQKEQIVSIPAVFNVLPDEEESSRERVVILKKQKIGGLGLSIKGGAEHEIPILISRIFKNQAADQTGQLYVGDAILKVNNVDIQNSTHEEAVIALKNAGHEIKLTVKYFKEATPYLQQTASNRQDDVNNDSHNLNGWQQKASGHSDSNSEYGSPKLEKHWTDVLLIPLLMARVTQYTPGTDKIRLNAFEVCSMHNQSSGIIHSSEGATINEWIRTITANIATVNAQSIKTTNDILPENEHILHMGWISERTPSSVQWQNWRPAFMAIKGSDIMIFSAPPANTSDWVRCERVYKLYETMFRVLQESEHIDQRTNCFHLKTGNGLNLYLSTETNSELTVWISAIQNALHTSVIKLGSKTYGCTWNLKVIGLKLDLKNASFTAFDAQNKQTILWTFKFSQLKNSSDNGKTKITLNFSHSYSSEIQQELECPNMMNLLYCIHAFLSTKVALVDPDFMKKMTSITSGSQL